MTDIQKKYLDLQQQLEEELKVNQRPIKDAIILPVSKRKSIDDIQQLADIGVCHFAENYIQEAVKKIKAFSNLPHLQWHFIGLLQSKKTKLIANHIHWLHSLESLKQAQRLSQQRTDEQCPLKEHPLNVCLQVNWFNEGQKGGIDPKNTIDFAEQIATLPGLKLRGLMLIGKIGLTQKEADLGFYNMQRLFKMTKRFMLSHPSLNQHADNFDTLSMGMSSDWQQAIKQGSTIIRIGTQIFGARE